MTNPLTTLWNTITHRHICHYCLEGDKRMWREGDRKRWSTAWLNYEGVKADFTVFSMDAIAKHTCPDFHRDPEGWHSSWNSEMTRRLSDLPFVIIDRGDKFMGRDLPNIILRESDYDLDRFIELMKHWALQTRFVPNDALFKKASAFMVTEVDAPRSRFL